MRFGRAQIIKGYQAQARSRRVGATAKHFPGLGDVATDPDTGVVSSPQTLAQVKKFNLPTLAAAIRAGVDQAASVSRFSPAQVALKAQPAGNDLLLEIAQPNQLEGADAPPANLLAARRALLRTVKRDPDRRRALKASVVRMLSVKWRLGLVKRPFANPSKLKRVVGTPAHLAVARSASQRSITLLRNDAGLLPLAAHRGQRVFVTGFGEVTTATLGKDIAARGCPRRCSTRGSTRARR